MATKRSQYCAQIRKETAQKEMWSDVDDTCETCKSGNPLVGCNHLNGTFKGKIAAKDYVLGEVVDPYTIALD